MIRSSYIRIITIFYPYNPKPCLVLTTIGIACYKLSISKHFNIKALRSFYNSRYFNRQALGFAAVIAATSYVFYLYAQLLSRHNRVGRSTA